MYFRLVFVIVYLFLFHSASAQRLIPYRKGNLWGYANKRLKPVIACTYERSEFFEGNLARVKKNGQWGLIDTKGQQFLPCNYDIVYGAFKDERIVVCKGGDKDGHGGHWGILPRYEGKEIPLRYDLLRECGIPGFLGVSVYGKWGMINQFDAKMEILPQYEVENIEDHQLGDFTEPLSSIAEISKIFPAPGREYQKLRFHRGLARVKRNGKWGYINFLGLEAIPLRYEFVGEFSEGMLCVVSRENQTLKIGFVDQDHKLRIPFMYDFVEGIYKYLKFEEGLVPLRKDGKWGYVSDLHEVVIPFQYAQAGKFSDERALVSESPSSLMPVWKCLDKQGNVVFELEQGIQLPEAYFIQGFLRIKSQGKEAFLNREGKQVGQLYERVFPFEAGLAQVVARVGDSLKTGFMDTEGNEVVPLSYDFSEGTKPFSRKGNFIFVRKHGFFGVIDLNGREWISCSYENILEPNHETYSVNRLAVQKNGLWGFINSQEKWIIPPRYDQVQNFEKNYALVKYQNRWGYIRSDGKEFFEE